MGRVDLESIPAGFRFFPTDEELVNQHLKPKTQGLYFKVPVIPEVDICKWEPWQLPDFFLRQFRNTCPDLSEIQAKANDNRWYFFCPRDVKNRVNRSTEAGFWKPTGKDRIIKSRDSNTSIGTKKTLVFHTGRVRDSKGTDWVIHEYQLTPDPLNPPKKGFVLCLLKNDGEVEPSAVSGSSPSDNFALPVLDNSHHTNHLAEDPVELSPEDQEFLWQCFSAGPTNQQPQMHQEQGFSDMDLLYYNGFTNNEHEEMQFQSYTMESIDDSGQYLVSEDEYTLAESRGHRAMAARRSEMPETHLVRVSSDCSLTKEYVKDSESSSETDTEVVLQSRVDPIVATLRSLDRQYKKENVVYLDNESGGSSPSSVNSIADKPIEINFRQLTSAEFPVNNARTSRPQYQLRSHNFVAQGTSTGKLCVQEVLPKEPKLGKVRESSCITVKHEGRPDSIKTRVTATKLPQKEKAIVVSNNDLGMAGGGGAKRLSLKPKEQEESSGKNQKGGSNFVATSLASSHGSSPPSDYAFNSVLGIILLGLFVVFVVLDVTHRFSSIFN